MNNRRYLVERVREAVEEDFGHLDRVARLSRTLDAEGGADPEVTAVAAYVHDHHRLPEHERGRGASSAESLPEVRRTLMRAGAGPHLRRGAEAAVAITDTFTFAGASADSVDAVAACSRDADMLDEIGAIGIARAFMYGGSTGEPMRVATEQLQTVYPGGRTSSVVLRFHEKPLRLREETSTSSGKREAERRHQPVLRFPQFLHEEHGDLDTAPAHRFEDAL